jgi:hypothetical protein
VIEVSGVGAAPGLVGVKLVRRGVGCEIRIVSCGLSICLE